MTEKTRKTLLEQFRTLDDPELPPSVGPYPVQPLPAERQQWKIPAGHWRSDLSRRPNAWRRFWTWALLGWRWHQYPE